MRYFLVSSDYGHFLDFDTEEELTNYLLTCSDEVAESFTLIRGEELALTVENVRRVTIGD